MGLPPHNIVQYKGPAALYLLSIKGPGGPLMKDSWIENISF